MKRIAVMSLFLSIGCMIGPSDGDAVSSRVDPLTFSGYFNAPNEVIEIQVYNDAIADWTTIERPAYPLTDPVTSALTPSFTDSSNREWYSWSVTMRPPRTAQFWRNNNGGDARFRARDSDQAVLYTGTLNEWNCVYSAIVGGSSVAAAYSSCNSPSSFEAAVEATSCDVVVEGGCFDTVQNTHIPDWPDYREYALAEEIQGVTTDENYWYFSNADPPGHLARYPIGADLNVGTALISDPFNGWNHPGDMDVHDGWLFVPLEEPTTHSTNAIGFVPVGTFSDKSSYRYWFMYGDQASGGSFPWIAHDPITGYLYSSTFGQNGTSRLHRYRIIYDSVGPVSLTWCGTVQLNQPVYRVQGGDFSESGRLYLSVDDDDHDREGIEVVEMNGHLLEDIDDCNFPPSTEAQIVQHIDLPVTEQRQELEGITVRDFDDGSLFGGTNRGQIHTLLLSNQVGTDNFWLKHDRISPVSDL